jgi:WG containing repeat
MKTLIFMFAMLPLISMGQQSFNENGKYGFRIGEKTIIEPQYEYAADFVLGTACVKKAGKWGYINTNNEWKSGKYDKVQPIMNGFGYFLLNGKLGLVDSTGAETLAGEYDKIEFYDDYFKVTNDSKEGLVSKKINIPCKYNYVRKDNNGYAYAKREDKKYDIYDQTGLVLEGQSTYFSRYRTTEKHVVATQDDMYGIFNVETKAWDLKPKYAKIKMVTVRDYEDGSKKPSHKVYAVFKKFDPSNANNTSNQGITNCDIIMLKTTSLDVITKGVTGYKTTSYYQHGKKLKCELYMKKEKEPVLIRHLIYE